MDVISKIRKLQADRKWTDYKLCKEAGLSQSTFATIFSRGTPPKLDILQCICDAFGITLAQFFLEDEQIEILSNRETQMLAVYRRLTSTQQQALIDLLDK